MSKMTPEQREVIKEKIERYVEDNLSFIKIYKDYEYIADRECCISVDTLHDDFLEKCSACNISKHLFEELIIEIIGPYNPVTKKWPGVINNRIKYLLKDIDTVNKNLSILTADVICLERWLDDTKEEPTLEPPTTSQWLIVFAITIVLILMYVVNEKCTETTCKVDY